MSHEMLLKYFLWFNRLTDNNCIQSFRLHGNSQSLFLGPPKKKCLCRLSKHTPKSKHSPSIKKQSPVMCVRNEKNNSKNLSLFGFHWNWREINLLKIFNHHDKSVREIYVKPIIDLNFAAQLSGRENSN